MGVHRVFDTTRQMKGAVNKHPAEMKRQRTYATSKGVYGGNWRVS